MFVKFYSELLYVYIYFVKQKENKMKKNIHCRSIRKEINIICSNLLYLNIFKLFPRRSTIDETAR